MRFRFPISLLIIASLLAIGCNLGQPTGGGTGVEGLNGTLVVPTGAPAAGATLRVYTESSLGKASANPVAPPVPGRLAESASHAAPFDSAVSDADGRFSFPDLVDGTYSLLATYTHQGGTFVLLLNRLVVSGETPLGYDTLKLSGSLSVTIDADDAATAGAACILTGTPFHVPIDSSGRCTLTGLPSGTFELAVENGSVPGGVVGDFLVVPGNLTDGGVHPLPGGTETPLPAPALVSPPNDALVGPGDSLAWTFFTGATGYHLQITQASDPNFLAPVFDDTLPGPRHTLASSPAGTYAWRVRALNAAGPGPWSAARSFVIADTADTAGTGVPATHFPITASTMALWTFDSLDTLNRYADLSGKGRHLTAPQSGTLTESPLGMAVSFTNEQYVSVPDDDSLVIAMTPILTYEARIWLDAYPSSEQGVAMVMGQYAGLRMLINHEGRISVDAQTNNAGGAWVWYGPVTEPGVMPVGQWVDVAVAANGSGGHLYVYINGTAVQTYNNIEKGSLLRHLTTADYPFTVGNDSGDPWPFRGRIEEIRISDSLVLGPGFIPIVQPIPGR